MTRGALDGGGGLNGEVINGDAPKVLNDVFIMVSGEWTRGECSYGQGTVKVYDKHTNHILISY